MAGEEVVVRNPLLDRTFDVTFVLLSVAAAVMAIKQEYLLTLIASMLGTGVVIVASSAASGAFGSWVSRTFLNRAPFNNPISSPITRHKFTAQSWQLVVHVSMTALAWQILRKTEWLEKMWLAAPWYRLGGESAGEDARFFYMMQLAIWIVTCISHRFIEEKHKDYYVMYAHHLTTIGIVVFSFTFDYIRFGIVIFFIHDSSDVMLDLMKIINLFKLTDREGFFITEIIYVIQMCCWVYTRLYLFPKLIVQGIFYNLLLDELPDGTPSLGKLLYEQKPDYYYFETRFSFPIAAPLLMALQIMHVWWTLLMLRIGYRAFAGGRNIHDVGRDEYEGASDDEGDDKNKKLK